MVHDGSVTRLIKLLRSGDRAERDMAARLIWLRYFRDLLDLARKNLNRRIHRREDEEDVLQSMYKGFCMRQQAAAGVRSGRPRCALEPAGDDHAPQGAERGQKAGEGHAGYRPRTNAANRRRGAVGPLGARADGCRRSLARRGGPGQRGPGASAGGGTGDPRVAGRSHSRLEGYTIREIADSLDCTERSVERRLERIRSKWMSYDDGGLTGR